MPDFDGVEPEPGLRLGAVGDLEVVAILVSGAVVPQTDEVEVLDVELILGVAEELGQLVGDLLVQAGPFEDVCRNLWIRGEIAQIRLDDGRLADG